MEIKKFVNLLKSRIAQLSLCLRELLWGLGERVFSLFFLMIFLAVLVALAVFFKEIVLPQRQKPVTTSQLTEFDRQSLEKISLIWQKRQLTLQVLESQDYPDLFNPKAK